MGRRGRRNRNTQQGPYDDAAWVRATDERLGTSASAGESYGPVSLSPRSKAASRQNWRDGPAAGDLSEPGLAQFRGQGDRTVDETNALLRTGFDPQRHSMIVEGRPVVVLRNVKPKLGSWIFKRRKF